MITIKINIDYYTMSLNDKIEICRKHNAKWIGATYENKITTIILKP
jgi:hypothetical protein